MTDKKIAAQAKKIVHSRARGALEAQSLGVDGKSPLRANLFGGAVSAVMQRLSIANLVGRQMFGQRDLYATFGYSRVIRYIESWQRYRRQDIFARVIDAPVSAIWSNPPSIVSTNEAWNKAWNELVVNHNLYRTLARLDKMAGLGDYALLLVGFDGMSPNLTEPVVLKSGRKVTYMQPYDYASAQITRLITDPTSPRYLKPELYRVLPMLQEQPKPTGGWPIVPFQLHYSHAVHIGENFLTDEIFGSPRAERIWNLADDLLKVCGGSAEMYWLAANRGMQMDVDREMELSTEDEDALSQEIDEYMNNLRRFIRTRGVKIHNLGSDTPDPTGVFRMLVQMISGATGIPARILVGSEAGQLASTQDRANWADRIQERRTEYVEPTILYPLIRLLTNAGVLPTEGTITITWPDAFQLSPLEKSQMASAQALAASNLAKVQITAPKLLSNDEARGIINFEPAFKDVISEDLLNADNLLPQTKK